MEEIIIAYAMLKLGDTFPVAYCTGKLYKLKACAILKIDCDVLYVRTFRSLLTIYVSVII